jgi:hypothetical protein
MAPVANENVRTVAADAITKTTRGKFGRTRTNGSIVMHIFKGKEPAIDAACGLLNRGYSDALEVGPMLGTRKGNLLKERDIRRIRDDVLPRSEGN